MPARRGGPSTTRPRETAVDDDAPIPTSTAGRRPSGASGSEFLRRGLAGAIYAAALLLMVRIAAAPLTNTDTFFHLRFGSEFLHHWSLRDPGSVSSFATSPWLPTQWLPEEVMARVEETFGLAGVSWLFGVQLVALLTALYLVARSWADPLAAVLLVGLALAAASEGLSMRPQMLSFLMVTVTVGAWLRTRDDARLRWWLVPMTWVWATSHGMWPVGIVIGAVAVAGLALDRSLPRERLLRAALVPALSAVAAALTPVGPALYGAVLGVGSRAQYFSEWDSPDYHNPACIVLAVLFAITVGLVVRRPATSRLDLALLLLAGGCAVWSWRTVPLAAMILVPLAATQLRGTTESTATGIPRVERLLVTSGAAVALVALAVAVPHTSSNPPAQPSWVDPALSSLPAGTKVVDDWGWGGYLMWRYPQLDLLMHGYGDTFTAGELQRNSDIEALAPDWDNELKATGCTIAVLRPTSALTYALRHQEHWAVVHESATIVELRAPAGWSTATG